MAEFETFTLFYAKSLAENGAADALLKITNADKVKLVYCIPIDFTKRQTDTSNAQAEDKTSPDTGTARAGIEIRFTQERDVAPSVNVLKTLMDMFYKKSNDVDFRKARFGLENDDNPELDVTPTNVGGYKFQTFRQEPNPNDPAILVYTVQLDFIGDHTLLGAFQ
jgi:hypothetical protein